MSISIPETFPLFYKWQKVLTNNQLSGVFECTRQVINSAFNYNKKYFEAEIDYFFLEKDELRKFKDKYAGNNSCTPVSRLASSLYLWTQSGVEKLAKYIGTDKAKLIYSALVFGYFQSEKQLNLFPQDQSPELSPIQKYNELKFLIAHCKDKNLRDELIKKAAELI